jgi:hypothetical protein
MPAKQKTTNSVSHDNAPTSAKGSGTTAAKGNPTARHVYKKQQEKRQSQARRSLRVAVADDVELEALYTAACKDLAAVVPRPSYNSIVVRYGHRIGESTLRRRYRNLAQSARNAHTDDQLLTPEQEKVLVEWLIQRGLQGRPASQAAVRAQVKTLIGHPPSRRWVKRFESRNPSLTYSTTNGLDPKRASCFNRTAIQNHFQALAKAIELGVKTSNMYNVDEQGIQRGGSRKRGRKKFFMGRKDIEHYKLRSENQELVTIIDCVCADGNKLVPTFIFSGNNTFNIDWFRGHKDSHDIT